MSVTFDKRASRWRFKFDRKINGQQIRATKLLPKGWTSKEADEYDRQQTAEIYASATGVSKKQHLIEDAVLIYCQERCPELKRGEEFKAQLARDFEHYAGLPITALPDVAATIRALPLSAGTKRNRIAYLRAACRYAFKYHGIGEHDPAERLPPITVKNERHFYFSRKEMLTICKKMKRIDARAIVRIAFYTGLRQSEILRCEVVRDRIIVRDTKNGEAIHVVPVHPRIRSAVKLAPFSIKQFTLAANFRKAKNKVGFDDYRFHDLRHSAASEMINAGVDLHTVGAVLNHKSGASTRRYAHLAMENIDKAVRLIGRK